MDLPLILDLALGLVLTYLILSLLASEVQEILSSLLQWRAEHLRRSIEQLLEGDSLENTEAAQALAERLYSSPLISSLNYEAKGSLASIPRKIFHGIGALYRSIFRVRNTFGQNTSGPSYIPSKTFATALLDSLNLGKFQQLFTEARLRKLFEDQIWLPINHVINDLRVSNANEYLLASELKQFEQAIGQTYQDFKAQRITLSQTIQLALTKLDRFIAQAETALPADHHFTQTCLTRLTHLRDGLAATPPEIEALLQKIQPTLAELLQILNQGSELYQEAKTLAQQEDGIMKSLIEQLESQALPNNLKENLLGMAEQTQRTLQKVRVDDALLGFEQEVEQWFDNAMERAGGVYNRNAKIVAILIGIAIAYSVNADTFHIASRLTNDQTLRVSITQVASQIDTSSISADDPEQLKEAMNAVTSTVSDGLEELPLPIGRKPQNLAQQKAAEENWRFPVPRRVFGWLVTGVAISMGANFWYSLLKRVINVRTTGDARGVRNSNGSGG
ncbi:MAG: hypothetical protein AAFX95_06015 [Cyanobacteria bacterium J06639_16]